MYTRCPDCHTTFRVTADVLKQASGNVRCGGCGNAFSALEFLSESMPGPEERARTDEELPELKPESQAMDSLPGLPSADQSAALLKTLDELAGSDVRIEDTGIEWRVLGEDEVGAAADDDIAVDIEVEDQPAISEIFDTSPTPVDQFLSSSPTEVDLPEIFADEVNEPARTPVDELRFDDNTPLPEDFGFDDASTVVPLGVVSPEEESLLREAAADPQVDLELTHPDDWEDLLGEFENIAGDLSESTITEGAATLEKAPDDIAQGPDARSVGHDLEALLEETANEVRHLDDLLEDSRVDEINMTADHAGEPEAVGDVDVEFTHALDESSQLELIEPDDGRDASMTDLREAETGESARTGAAPDEGEPDFGDLGEPGDEATQDHAEISADTMLEDASDVFESIVMEGEMITAGRDDPKFIADQKAAAASLASAAKEKAENEAREAAVRAGKRKYGFAAGIGFLVLLLAGQYLHQERNSLATIAAFNNVAAPVYRALGKPLVPEWDVTGWRFETTRHDSDGADKHLAISSRLGNVSETALPYPIIAVSLSDRFEEPLGSLTLGPAEYLADDLDPRQLVDPGNTFEAAILVRNVPANTTSFRLRVCYRVADRELRCKEDGFL
jgi:predicted Zn finger-like uncharacterized protein